ncbi:helix-turn-helix transcriptional regulator [Proteinivorax tanatarense]|uniref:Helix-turn-helix transcriptional regulator n=1 Tax=Proteinivorax tanatarense TaxID=1260629 RepID=A0AAU7VNF2_9FIRM
MRIIRYDLNLTQKNVSELSGISEDAIRKIKHGKVTPTQETLELLSVVLKTDLNKLLLNMRVNDLTFN